MIKTPDNFKIIYETGETFDMSTDLSVLVRSLNIASPDVKTYSEGIEGRDGLILLGKDLSVRKITADCSITGDDLISIDGIRDKLISALYAGDYFYIIPDSTPTKRWKVYIAQGFELNRKGNYGEFTLQFDCIVPYAESATSNVQTKTTTTFVINNPGYFDIDPRKGDLVITYTGASTNLTIRNDTTGDEWQYSGTSGAADIIILDGIRSTKNGLSIFRNTNRNLITLKSGDNSFTLSGTSGTFSIKFEFRDKYIN